MQKRTIQRGRPFGSTRQAPDIAAAFGNAVRSIRIESGVAQEALAHKAGIERSHMGKIERGEHLPSLALVFKIAGALDCSVTALIQSTEEHLRASQADA